mgnify:CR=1 FL=1
MKWQDDSVFVDWLLEAKYAVRKDGKVVSYLGLGLILYMYEAFQLGKQQAD